MKEELPFVTEDQAKKLKELGFDYPCDKGYPEKIRNIVYYIPKPTTALTLKWLRDKHDIYIRPFRQYMDVDKHSDSYGFEINHLGEKNFKLGFKSWEETELEGITNALNLLKNENNIRNISTSATTEKIKD